MEATRAVVEEILAEQHLAMPITLVPVENVTAAQRLGFLGSPTVRIDGRDVDPAAHTMSGWSMSCRVYLERGHPQGVPPKTMVARAIAGAAGRQINL